MNKFSTKLLCVLAIFVFIAIIPIVAFAANEDVSVVTTSNEENKTEYIIYIKNYTDQKFKYAFSNNAKPEVMDLVYINSITTNVVEDLKSNEAAFLDAETYEKLLSQPIYMWAKDVNENLILDGIQLDLKQSLTKTDIETVETVTKRIAVKVADSEDAAQTIRQENVNGVEETASVGFVEIVDNDEATYFYKRIKLPSSDESTRLMILAEKLNKEYEAMDMYEKIQVYSEFNSLYSILSSEDNWQEVENKTINQPEDSVAGDKYILFIKKVTEGVETIDAQFLTCYDDYTPEVIKEQIITQETAKLPITYDSIALIVVLVVIVIVLVLIFIRIKKLSNKDEQK